MQFWRGNKKGINRDIQRQLVGTNGKKAPKRSQNLKSCLTRKINFQALHIVFITLIDPSMRCIEAKNSIFRNSRCLLPLTAKSNQDLEIIIFLLFFSFYCYFSPYYFRLLIQLNFIYYFLSIYLEITTAELRIKTEKQQIYENN